LNDVAIILLGGKRGGFALVDAEDFPALNQFKWTKHPAGYLHATILESGKWRTVRMHRQILNAPAGIGIDHRNHCQHDNTRRNLRVATTRQNSSNRLKWKTPTSSRFKGVSWDDAEGKWRARIRVNYRGINLGRFRDEAQAARAYNEAARKQHGEFASLNPV